MLRDNLEMLDITQHRNLQPIESPNQRVWYFVGPKQPTLFLQHVHAAFTRRQKIPRVKPTLRNFHSTDASTAHGNLQVERSHKIETKKQHINIFIRRTVIALTENYFISFYVFFFGKNNGRRNKLLEL